jgi:hypothetical protein
MRINKQIGLTFAFSILTSCGFGQSLESFDKLVSKTNEFLIQYHKLSPFGSENFISLKESHLPKKNIKYIKTHLEKYDGYSKDSISEFNLLLEFQDLIMGNIERIISHNKFEENNIKELITDEGDLSIAVSDDNKLYNFSLAEKIGGTYRSHISIMYYTEINQDSLPTSKEIEKRVKISPYTVFEGDGFNEIYSIKTEEGTKYILTGYVRGCSYCFETNIMLVKFKDGIFEQDFVYSISSRSWEEGVSYDSKSKTITVDYITDDLTTDCDCSNYAKSDEEQNDYNTTNEETKPIKKRCHCTFEFNGLNFELTKER